MHASKCRSATTVLVALLVLAAAVAACGGAGATPRPAGATPSGVAAMPAEVSVADAARLRDAGAFILDVREPDEWAAGHIPGATLIALGDLAGRVAEVPKDRDVVVVCRSGNRSAQGRDILRAAGYGRATSMAGGMNDWSAAAYEVVTGP